MANPYQKLTAGSPVTAFSLTAYNRLMDMLVWWETNQAGGGGRIKTVDWDQTVFRVKNTTGADLASYDPIGISGPIFDPTDDDATAELLNQTSMTGVAPTVADHGGGKWGVMTEAAANGKIGRCCLVGVVPVRVYVTSYLDSFCDIIAEETVDGESVKLGSGPSGAKIVWWEATEAADDETIVWAIVRIGDENRAWRYGKLDAILNSGSSAAASQWTWSGSAWADSTNNDTVYAPPLLSSGSIASGKWVRYEWCTWSKRWEVVSAEC